MSARQGAAAASTRVYIGLGSNLGDRRAALGGALAALDEAEGVEMGPVSSLYETAPVGGPGGQGSFLNACAALDARLEPLALLDLLQSIEAAHDRRREIRWGPRTLDLDILFFGDMVLDAPRLALPHPRIVERRFVLAPLAEIAGGLQHPETGRTMAEHLAALDPSDIDDVARLGETWVAGCWVARDGDERSEMR